MDNNEAYLSRTIRRYSRDIVIFGWLVGCLSACTQPTSPTSSHSATPSILTTTSNARFITDATNNWSSPVEVATVTMPTAQDRIGNVSFAMTAQGDTFIAWQTIHHPIESVPPEPIPQNPRLNAQIQLHPINATKWQASLPFESTASIGAPQLFTHHRTNIAYAIWDEIDFSQYDIGNHWDGINLLGLYGRSYISRFDPATGWGPALQMASRQGYEHTYVIMDELGNATIIWITNTAEGYMELHARHYAIDKTGLSAMSTHVLGTPDQPYLEKRIASVAGFVNSEGITEVYWLEQSMPDRVVADTQLQLWYGRYHRDTGWKKMKAIRPTVLNLLGSQLSIAHDPISNDVLALVNVSNFQFFEYYFPEQTAVAYVARSAKGQWSPFEKIALPAEVNAGGSNFAVNIQGEAALVWSEANMGAVDPTLTIKSQRLSLAQGWSEVETLATHTLSVDSPGWGPRVSPPQVLMNNQGLIAALWANPLSSIKTYHATHYTPSDSWHPAERVISDNIDIPIVFTLSPRLTLSATSAIGLFWGARIPTQASTPVTTEQTYQLMFRDYTTSLPLTSPAPVTTPLVNLNIHTPQNDQSMRVTEPTPPTKQSINWSTPVIVWEMAHDTSTPQTHHFSYLSSPILSHDLQNRLYLSIHANLDYDENSRQYANQDRQLLSFQNDNTWQTQLLPSTSSDSVLTQIQMATDDTTGQLFIAWTENTELFVSTQSTGTWQTPQSITPTVDDFYIMSDLQGGAYVVWYSEIDLTRLNLSQLSVQTNGNITLQPPVVETVLPGKFSDKPAINSLGHVAVLWLGYQTNGFPTQSLHRYQSLDSGWAINAPLPLREGGMDKNTGLISPTTDTQWIAITQTLPQRQLFSTRFDPDTGWSDWVSIDNNNGQLDAVMGRPRLVHNRQGEVMILWVEESLDETGTTHWVYTNTFHNTADAQGNYWEQPQIIGKTEHLPKREMPALFLADDGQAISVWRNTAYFPATLAINQLTPDTGWQAEPEQVSLKDANNQLLSITSPTGIILPSGKMVIIGKDIALHATEIRTWSISGQL